MSDFLRHVCAEAAERVTEARRLVPLSTLRAQPPPAAPALGAGLRAAAGAGVAVIAELKRASPSKGHLAWIPDSPAHALAYQAGGAAAISVLTEPAHFRGTLADLSVVAATVEVPVLRKDFVVDAYQVWEARQAGASGVLLIVGALGDAQLAELLGTVTTAGLEALVEVHDAHEAGRAAAALDAAGVKAPLVGVNARDLSTLQVDPGRFSACVQALPAQALTVAESGVSGPDDVARAVGSGADAVLVGEHLVTAADPRSAVDSLVHAAATTGSRL